MSTARDHAEWLSLVESSGPFVSVPVLMRTFPQGLDARNPEQAALLREAYEDWLDRGPTQPAVHRLWVLHVLTELLGYPTNLLTEGQTLPPGLEAPQPQYGETIRPDFALKHRGEGNKPCLLIQTYAPDQDLEKPVANKPWKASPGTRMMELLHATDIPVGLITNGEQWMLVNARRGESTGFASWYADLWMQEPITLRAFHSLLGLRRVMGVAEPETLPALLAESSKDQQEVTDQLGTQVRHAVEVLVQAFDRIDADTGRTLLAGVSEKDLYDSALTVMMRLVFLFSAEERGLLLLGDRLYDEHYAVSTLREILHERAEQQGEEVLERRSDAWARLLATFRVVHGGVAHEAMRLPAYGGSLFNPNKYPHLEGRAVGTSWKEAAAKPLAINNRVVLHLLEALQILRIKVPGGGPAEARRISFRALDIEQIGHVYEGLLDHEARRAEGAMLGLLGKKGVEPEVPLADLEAKHAEGADALIAFLIEKTGRTEKTLRKAVAEPKVLDEGALLAISGNDRELMKRIAPFAALLRKDSYDQWMVVLPGSLYVTTGNERHSTGTHYTPRSLTEPVVQYTLEPLVYTGPTEGLPKAEWKLKTAKEILALKVCDLAMGSGAFLVQACRYLSERLVEAWAQLEKAAPGMVVVTPEGELSSGDPTERIVPRDAAERIAVARRYVADRCLYGVDINPMAVEMAKLSLWLITLQKDRPFNFLDHAFKCGDSLLGVSTVKQIENFSLRPGDRQITLATVNMFRYVEEAAAKRLALEALPSNDFSQIEAKNRLHSEAETATAKVKAIADCLTGLEMLGLSDRLYDSARDAAAEKVQALIQQDTDAQVGTATSNSALAQEARAQLRGRRAFHWPLEFPEVISNGGFHGVIGNPPFLGGSKITIAHTTEYRDFLVQHIARGEKGKADLAVYFLLRANGLLRESGTFGLVATTSIAEGDARQVGLGYMVHKEALCSTIYRAYPNRPWPGSATVTIAMVWLRRGPWLGSHFLDDRLVSGITPALIASDEGRVEPYRLKRSQGVTWRGTEIKGPGFVLSDERAQGLFAKDALNRQVIFPYISGEDINASPTHTSNRWVINFHTWSLEKASQFKDCFEIVRRLVKPYRDTITKQVHEPDFWKLWDKRLEKYAEIKDRDEVLAISLVTKHVAYGFVPVGAVYSNKVQVFSFSSFGVFAVLQSCFHFHWAWKYSPRNLSMLAYSPQECVEKFPLPGDLSYREEPDPDSPLWRAGQNYYRTRQELMHLHGEGLTTTYNRVHDSADQSEHIASLRELQVEMDRSVAASYGWSDLDLEHGFHETKQGKQFTISETARREVLDRLLALNHQRYAEEVAAGLHDKKKGTGKKGKGNAGDEGDDTPDLFTEQ
jgi:hypothetical protein